jgi:enoyl-CoA hydratase
MGDRVQYTADDGVATITMDDGKVNVLSPAMLSELNAALDQAATDSAVVILAGRAGVFSSGFDLTVLRAGGFAAFTMVRAGFETAERMLAFPTPVVVACTGHAIAMGAFLLLSGDYRLGADGTYTVAANEVAIGLTVPHAAVEVLRGRLTPSSFHRAVALAEPFTPRDAAAAGFLDRVVDPIDLLPTSRQVAATLTALDMPAHRASKLRARALTLDAVRRAIAEDTAEFHARSAHRPETNRSDVPIP